MQKCANLVEFANVAKRILSTYLQNSASIQPRTSSPGVGNIWHHSVNLSNNYLVTWQTDSACDSSMETQRKRNRETDFDRFGELDWRACHFFAKSCLSSSLIAIDIYSFLFQTRRSVGSMRKAKNIPNCATHVQLLDK